MGKISLLLALSLLFLSGCSSEHVPTIEDYSWIMTSVQSMDADGQVIAFGERGSSTLASAKQVDLTCEVENGNLTLIDQTNDKTL